jgi:REP element-mobilizing transposase RayT
MKHFDGKRYLLGDYIIMPNHIHVLIVPGENHPLGKILQSWKSFSAKAINRKMARTGALWQKESFDHIIRNREQLNRLREYIAENPVKAKLRDGEFVHRVAKWA